MTKPKATLAAHATAAAVLAGLVLGPGATMAQAGTRRCPNFSVPRTYTATPEMTFTFSKVRATGVSCRKTRELITRYLWGKGRPAGASPTDGAIVDGWNVLVLAATATGRRGHASFSAVYR
jgi:hypothetical protein